jgi:hypothetical protein
LARINIDDDLESKPEFRVLTRLLGGNDDTARGALVRWFRLAQHAYAHLLPVPKEEIKKHELECVITAGWALPVEGGFRCKGEQKQFGWYRQRVQAGIIRAQASREENGQFRPSKVQRPASGSPAECDSGPASYSSSYSYSKDNTEYTSEESVANAPSEEVVTGGDTKTKDPVLNNTKGFFDAHGLRDMWNSFSPPLPKVIELSDDRKNKIAARLKKYPESDYWRTVIERIVKTPFLIGKSERGWRANIDWLLKPGSPTKVLEGLYDDKSQKNNAAEDWKPEPEEGFYA